MSETSPRKFAVFDIDGTLIRWQLYHAVVNELIQQNLIPPKAGQAIEEARMTWKRRDHKQSFRDYEKIVVDTYKETLHVVPIDAFNKAAETVFEEYKDQVYTYTRDLVFRLKNEGYLLFAISGSHQEVVTRLASYYGFDDAVGQEFKRVGSKFTGEHTTPMHQKDVVLKQLAAKHGATFKDSIAVGDSEGDAAMFRMVDNPIVFNPTNGLYEMARDNNWAIVVERKNVIYELNPSKNGTYLLA